MPNEKTCKYNHKDVHVNLLIHYILDLSLHIFLLLHVFRPLGHGDSSLRFLTAYLFHHQFCLSSLYLTPFDIKYSKKITNRFRYDLVCMVLAALADVEFNGDVRFISAKAIMLLSCWCESNPLSIHKHCCPRMLFSQEIKPRRQMRGKMKHSRGYSSAGWRSIL